VRAFLRRSGWRPNSHSASVKNRNTRAPIHAARTPLPVVPPTTRNIKLHDRSQKPQRGFQPQTNRCFDSESKLRWIPKSQTPNLNEVLASLRGSSFCNPKSAFKKFWPFFFPNLAYLVNQQ
jgi:hypothetical protein